MKGLERGVSKNVIGIVVLALAAGVLAAIFAGPSAVQAQAIKHEGYLADVLCATKGTALDGADMTKHPEKHSVACLKEPQCKDSGFGLMMKGKDDTYAFHKFDKKGNDLALELINKTKKKDAVAVEVTGTMKEGVMEVTGIVEK